MLPVGAVLITLGVNAAAAAPPLMIDAGPRSAGWCFRIVVSSLPRTGLEKGSEHRSSFFCAYFPCLSVNALLKRPFCHKMSVLAAQERAAVICMCCVNLCLCVGVSGGGGWLLLNMPIFSGSQCVCSPGVDTHRDARCSARGFSG